MKKLVRTCSKEKKWFWLLVAALAVYTVKSIFVGADIDEAYGVTLGYRLVQGDRLLWDMWEPHQTSAIFTALFIRLILLATGGSLQFMTIFLRVCFFLVQFCITLYLYKCLGECLPYLSRRERILFAMIYYVTTPKCNYVPEYSNLHIWFSTLLVLFLLQYFSRACRHCGKGLFLILAGAVLACDVLAYPVMAVFYPFCAGFILCKSQKGRRWREWLLFTLPCVLGAALFLGYLLSYMSVQDILTVLPCIAGDGSHRMGAAEKAVYLLRGLGKLLAMIAGCGIAAGVLLVLAGRIWPGREEITRDRLVLWLFLWFMVQTAFQVICWMHSDYNSGYPQIAYLAVPLFGLCCAGRSGKKDRAGIYMIALSLVNYAALNLFSNWEAACLTVYLVIGLLGGLLCFRQYFWERCGEWGLKLLRVICVVFLLSEVFGRCLLMIGGDEGCSMTFQVRGVSHEGVRGGIFTSYMNSYRYNNNYDLFSEIVPEGSNVLYLGPSQFYYMMGDCCIASPTTISTPEYDESLELYYELHPERFPDVVVMESCYGDVSYFDEDDYIFSWLDNSFGPYVIEEYPYVRVYRRLETQTE